MEKKTRVVVAAGPYLLVFQAKARDFRAIVVGGLRPTRRGKNANELKMFLKLIVTVRKTETRLHLYELRM